MTRIFITAVLLLACFSCHAQNPAPNQSLPIVVSQSFLAIGQGSPITTGSGISEHYLTWSPITNTPVTGCLIQVDGSPDGVHWSLGSIISSTACNTTGQANSTGASSSYVRINVTSLTTGNISASYSGFVSGTSVQGRNSGGGDVLSVFGRQGTVVGQSGDYYIDQITGGAPLASPSFTGTPTAPTQTTADFSTAVATDAFVKAQNYLTSGNGVTSFGGRTGAVTPLSGDYSYAQVTGAAPLSGPAFSGAPTAPTPATNDNSTTLATTAWVKNQGYFPPVWGNIGGTLSAQSDLNTVLGLKAPLASPTFSGTPTGPTSALSTNGADLVTSAWVKGQAYGAAGSAAWGNITGTLSAQTDLQTALTLKAPLASPSLTGTPTAPTVATGDNSTSVATTAWVKAQAYGSGPSAWGGIGGTLSAQTDLQNALNLKAPSLSPAFTGTPIAPTATLSDNSTLLATTAFVKGQAYAPLVSPALSGTPTAPTAATADNSTTLATTAFVKSQGYGSSAWGTITGTLSAQSDLNTALGLKAPLASPALTGTPTAPTALSSDSSTTLATTAFVKGFGYAPLASPAFTGTPVAPTQTTSDNTTAIATDAFVKAQAYAPLTSPTFSGSPVAPTPASSDSSQSLATTAFVKNQAYAPLASPALTGTPTAPTAGSSTNTTQVATTAFVKAQAYGTGTVTTTGSPASSQLPVLTGATSIGPFDASGSAAKGDVAVCTTAVSNNCTVWSVLSGNNSGSKFFMEDASGNASWGSTGAGTLTTTGSPSSGQLGLFSGATSLGPFDVSAAVVGDMAYCSAASSGVCTAWSVLPGNTTTAKVLQESVSGAPGWVVPVSIGGSPASGEFTVLSGATSFSPFDTAAAAAGDIAVCTAVTGTTCTTWGVIAGNTTSAKVLQESASGVASWTSAGTGTVTTTGSPATGKLAVFSGATSVAPLDATGAVTGDIAVCTAVAVGACTTWSVISGNASGNKVMMETSAGVGSWASLTTPLAFGSGAITCTTCVTSAAALTSTAIVTGGGLQVSQTPSATTTLDSSGNLSTPGSITGTASSPYEVIGAYGTLTNPGASQIAFGFGPSGKFNINEGSGFYHPANDSTTVNGQPISSNVTVGFDTVAGGTNNTNTDIVGTGGTIDIAETTTGAWGTVNANGLYITSLANNSTGTTATYLACESTVTYGTVNRCNANATDHVVGIVALQSASSTTGFPEIAAPGTVQSCTFDSATAPIAGSYAVTGSTTATCHDTGSTVAPACGNEIVGTIQQGTLGTGHNVLVRPRPLPACGTTTFITGSAVQKAVSTGAISSTLLFTAGASDATYAVNQAVVCTTATSTATVQAKVTYTDTSNTSEQVPTSTATCTTLGTTSTGSNQATIRVKAGTAVNYQTILGGATAGGYDVSVVVQQLTTN